MQSFSEGFLKIIQGWLPVLTVVVGGIWAVVQYSDQQQATTAQLERQSERESTARLLEAQQPFLKKQLDLYFETSKIVGELVTIKPTDANWNALETRFWALYWSELSMVEHPGVEARMKAFGDLLNVYKKKPDAAGLESLQRASYQLAHAIREGIQDAWKGDRSWIATGN